METLADFLDQFHNAGKSDDDKESKANSSKPVALMAASETSTISSTLRSRTGRVSCLPGRIYSHAYNHA